MPCYPYPKQARDRQEYEATIPDRALIAIYGMGGLISAGSDVARRPRALVDRRGSPGTYHSRSVIAQLPKLNLRRSGGGTCSKLISRRIAGRQKAQFIRKG